MISWIRKMFGGNDGGDTTQRAAARNARETETQREPFVVNLYDDRLVVHRPDGHREEVEWTQLDRVVVRVTNSGPWAGTWLILPGVVEGDGKPYGCVIPAEAVNYGEVLAHLQAMPGFDQQKYENAMRDARAGKSRSDAICWKRGAAPAAGSDKHDTNTNADTNADTDVNINAGTDTNPAQHADRV